MARSTPSRSDWWFFFAFLLVLFFAGCSWIPFPPQPQPTPTPEPPWECELPIPECGEVDQTCSTPESPCWHNPTQDPEHCEEAPQCPTPPDPPDPPEPPPACGFPQGAPNSDFTRVENPGVYGSVVNKAMAELSGCAVGTDCPITFGPDPWMALVCDKLCEQGLNCGRHINTPPGATDQISVKKGSFCDGKVHENYQIYNYGGKKVRWAPGGEQDGWILSPDSAVCSGEPEPPGECPLPHPDVSKMKFSKSEKGSHLDTTWITVNQPQFCASIGYCCMPGTGTPPNTCGSPGCIPRGGCPVRGDGDPLRSVCEAELCDQKWECNGAPYPPYRGNPAQTDCRGQYKTYCTNAPTVLEGSR